MSERDAIVATLQRAAERLPDVEQGIACAGTVIESRTYKIGGKAFLFLGPKVARFKLIDSAKEMAARAKKEGTRYSIGAGGWAALTLDGKSPVKGDLEKWVGESYRALGGGGGKPAAKPARAAKRSRSKSAK
jgi:hypothetical protein